jgi:hypothetical protein
MECLHNSDCDLIKQSELADAAQTMGEPLCSSGCDPVMIDAGTMTVHEQDQVRLQEGLDFSNEVVVSKEGLTSASGESKGQTGNLIHNETQTERFWPSQTELLHGPRVEDAMWQFSEWPMWVRVSELNPPHPGVAPTDLEDGFLFAIKQSASLKAIFDTIFEAPICLLILELQRIFMELPLTEGRLEQLYRFTACAWNEVSVQPQSSYTASERRFQGVMARSLMYLIPIEIMKAFAGGRALDGLYRDAPDHVFNIFIEILRATGEELQRKFPLPSKTTKVRRSRNH